MGDCLLEVDGAIVATGGILTHYNPPYGDIYMEVDEPIRRRGYGSYLVQEVKRACYEMGKVPAARCNASNGLPGGQLRRRASCRAPEVERSPLGQLSVDHRQASPCQTLLLVFGRHGRHA